MKQLTACTNPSYQKPTVPSWLDGWLARYLHDQRDLPFAYLLLKISATVLPLAVALFVPAVRGWAWWVVAGLFLYLSLLRFKGPFGLMLHCTSHRLLFKKQYGWLNHYIPWVVGPLFGQTPETYFVHHLGVHHLGMHHLGMHHAENNTADDESSTMFYQRDSVWGFLRYFSD